MGWDKELKRIDTQYRSTLKAILTPVRSADLSEKMKVTPATAVRRLGVLRKAGLARWTGRNNTSKWSITPKGREALASSDLITPGSRKAEPSNPEPAREESALWVLMTGARLPNRVTGQFVDRMHMSAEA